MTMNKKFKIEAKAKKAEIWIYADIGETWWGDGITAKQFVDELKAAGDVDEILVHMNSAGGLVFDGVAIYSNLKKHPAAVTVEIDGLAASIASLIAMAGNTVTMAENAMMMIHQGMGLAIGTADDMRDYAAKLDKIDDMLVRTYVDNSDRTDEQIREMLAAETWMSAQEALEYGFIDAITEEQRMAAHFDLSRFKNVPKKLESAIYTVKPDYTHRNKYKNEILTDRISLINPKSN
jgi:ATP-dependent Clp protease protease subunit